jgi:hypothetical protein
VDEWTPPTRLPPSSGSQDRRKRFSVLDRQVVLLAVVTGLLVCLLASSAAAYEPEPVVQENIPAIADHMARGGAVSIPGVHAVSGVTIGGA